MTPPVNPRSSRNFRTMPRRRERSARESILRDTPMWSTVGMKTRKRPGMVACEVMRAPFVPRGSFTTWTRISCPAVSSSSIFPSLASCFASDRPLPFPLAGAAARFPVGLVLAALGLGLGVGCRLVVSVARLEAVERLRGIDDVAHVEERVPLEPDVDERALHAG